MIRISMVENSKVIVRSREVKPWGFEWRVWEIKIYLDSEIIKNYVAVENTSDMRMG